MRAVWAQRQEELLSDCVVSPDVFDHMVDRLRDFVVPYRQCLETEAGQRNVHLYLTGLLSHLDRKNADRSGCTWAMLPATIMPYSTSDYPYPRSGHRG